MADNTTDATIAVLGTGIMGAPIARNLRKAGFEIRAFNRTRSKAEALADEGIQVADTPADAVLGARFVITTLATGSACEQVMAPPQGALAAVSDDAIWLQMSTVGIAATRRLSAMAADRGVDFVDTPVLGTKEPAENAQLVVLASGPQHALERSNPVFDAIARRVLWVGEVDAGSRLKLVVNNWLMSLVEGLAETIALAESIGVEPQQFLDTIKGEGIDVGYAHLKGPAMMARNTAAPSFPLHLAKKDAELVLEAATEHGVDLALTRSVVAKFGQAVESGHGNEDLAAAFYATAKAS